MCGICGAFQVDGGPRPALDADVLDRMTDSMTHRGPDQRGTHIESGAALGARRLAIVDVEAGRQPMTNENGTVWAAQNGEIYNHAELRRGLERTGHRFRTRCDTEVIPHVYERHGVSFVDRLRGMFGIAVWDASSRRGVVARDRLGIKPMYYARAGDLLLFGSEMKAVLASGLIDDELDYEAIDAYLTLGFFPGPTTPLRAVRKLEPGHRIVIEGGRVEVERYWAYPTPSVVVGRSEADHRDEVRSLVDEAVRMRLMADVPLGAMLSGGLDSSLVVALMARHSSGPVKTFAVGFREDPDSELGSARAVARALGTDHREVELSMNDPAPDLAELMWFMDEPVADLSQLGFHALSRLAREEVTVALSGQGADELFGGYPKHRAAALVGMARAAPSWLLGAGARALRHGPDPAVRMAGALAAKDPAERLLATSSRIDPALRAGLFRGPLAAGDGRAAYRAIARRMGGAGDDPLSASLYVDGQLALVDLMLHYFDRTSMSTSLEVRVPFLDHVVVEAAARIPSSLKVRRGRETKYILKEAARGLVPDWVIERRKVGFFHRTAASWIGRQAEGSLGRYLLRPDARTGEMLDPATIRSLVDGPSAGSGHTVLAALMLEVWLSEYLPRAIRPQTHPRTVPQGVGP